MQRPKKKLRAVSVLTLLGAGLGFYMFLSIAWAAVDASFFSPSRDRYPFSGDRDEWTPEEKMWDTAISQWVVRWRAEIVRANSPDGRTERIEYLHRLKQQQPSQTRWADRMIYHTKWSAGSSMLIPSNAQAALDRIYESRDWGDMGLLPSDVDAYIEMRNDILRRFPRESFAWIGGPTPASTAP